MVATFFWRARSIHAHRILDTGVDACVIATVEAELRSSSVSVVYVVRFSICEGSLSKEEFHGNH